ncbi:putative dehydrogenase [Pseudomonas fragi]|uniref:Putative dehydrogenase n=1 Tax=Pseudomonas fragi TaxID=296 RepID=A0A449IGC6_PSEFR|nr:putative dehydrogenase [Pseudomonas fragi]
MYQPYAQPGLTAYAAGKMAQLGIMNALSREGAADGILVNAVAPVAKTRMWGVNGEPDNLKPQWVTPGVIFLASAQCQDSGYILRASNGQFTATRFVENPGWTTPWIWPESGPTAPSRSPACGSRSRNADAGVGLVNCAYHLSRGRCGHCVKKPCAS